MSPRRLLTGFIAVVVLSLISMVTFHHYQRSPASAPSSFADVHNQVYGLPYISAPLPTYGGPSWDALARAPFGGGELIDRVKGTLTVDENFKPMAPKLLHPMGVCADAEWKIESGSVGTGLFAAGTDIHAIVRMSAADVNISYVKGEKRKFGLAIKLFPSGTESDKAVETANIFTLDHTGLDGEDRESYLYPASLNAPLYFQNTALGGQDDWKIRTLVWILKQYDEVGAQYRTLEKLAAVDQNGMSIASPKAPLLVRFVPVVNETADQKAKHIKADLREEILSYDAGQISFEIWVSKVDMFSALSNFASFAADTQFSEFVKVGQLTIGKAVASKICDQSLHFHHNKIGAP
jgi:hypothetical protein